MDFVVIVYLKYSHGFLSMIFGFLGNFRIDIAKNPHKHIFFQDQTSLLKKNENIFFETKKISKTNLWKSQWKMRISKFRFFFEKCPNFPNFHFSLTFPKKKIRDFWGLEKYFVIFFGKLFWSWKKICLCGFFAMSIRNFPRNPKITLRKPCDESLATGQGLLGRGLIFGGSAHFELISLHGLLETVTYLLVVKQCNN